MNRDPSELRAIFERVESTLTREGDKDGRTQPMGGALRGVAAEATDKFKYATDEDYFRQMVHVVFYSGMRAATVTEALPVIDRHFDNYSIVADYGDQAVAVIMSDTKMLKHEGKIRACVQNAKEFVNVVSDPSFSSFAAYLRSFANVRDLRADMMRRFHFLGKITSFHYLMEIGYPLVKPDRVVSRMFSRLGLVEGLPDPTYHPDPSKLSEEQLWQIVDAGAQIADATCRPIRYVDLVFVAYGQVKGQDPNGLSQGICLDQNPKCYLCGVRDYCQYAPKTLTPL
jgi:DNA-3-methyladenine glycosylase I